MRWLGIVVRLLEALTVCRGEAGRAPIAQVSLGRSQIAPIRRNLKALGLDGHERRIEAFLARFVQQLLKDHLRHGVLTLAEVVVADLSLLIGDVERRPEVIVERLPEGVVAIERNRVIHPHLFGGRYHVVDVALEAELGRMNPDHAQALIVVFVGPLTHVGQRSKPVDAGVRPELHHDDASAKPFGPQRLRVEPSGRALERRQAALARQDFRSGLPMRGEEAHRKPPPPSRYGARNSVNAASISSGACSATQWPTPEMTTVCTSAAAGFIPFPASSPQLSAPPIARTGIVSGRVLRSAFCARVVSNARYNPKLPRRTSGSE